MKLLFDENLSPRLVRLVADAFPESVHVRDVGLKGRVDDDLWQFALRLEFNIVSKDSDFRERSYVEGFPPKVIWLDVGNAGTVAIAQLLIGEADRARRFETDTEESVLALSLATNAV